MRVKTKNSAWVLFAAVSFGLGLLLACDTHGPSVNAAKPSAEAQPLFTPVTASLAQQKMCDEQAAKKFHENESSAFHEKERDAPISTYTSHYDPTVNVCYIRVHSLTAEPPLVTDVVYDAFGGGVRELFVGKPSEQKVLGGVSVYM